MHRSCLHRLMLHDSSTYFRSAAACLARGATRGLQDREGLTEDTSGLAECLHCFGLIGVPRWRKQTRVIVDGAWLTPLLALKPGISQ